MDFLNFDFSIGMARIGQLCRSRVARSFHSKDASLETAVRTDSCLIPYLPVSSLNTATVHECSPLSDIGKAEGRESRVVARRKNSAGRSEFYQNEGNVGVRRKRDCGIIDTFQTAGGEFAIVQVDLIDTTITPKFRNANTANMAYYSSTGLFKFTKQRNSLPLCIYALLS